MRYVTWILCGVLVGVFAGILIDYFLNPIPFGFFRLLYLVGGGAICGAVIWFVAAVLWSKRDPPP